MIGYFKTVRSGIKNKNATDTTPRIINKKEIIDFGVDVVKQEDDTLEQAQETLAEKIANGQYIEPYNFKSNTAVNSTKEGNGYLKIGSLDVTDPSQSKYFWVDELKNWCTYRVWAGCPVRAEVITLRVYYQYSTGGGGSYGPHGGNVGGGTSFSNFTLTLTNSDDPIYSTLAKTLSDETPSRYLDGNDEDVVKLIKQQIENTIDNTPGFVNISNKTRGYFRNEYYTYSNFFISKDGTEGYVPSVVWEHDHWQEHPERSYYKDIGMTAMQLCVWNGVDGFIPLNSFTMDSAYKEVAFIQNVITSYIMNINGFINKHRGCYMYNEDQSMCGYTNPQWYYSFDENVTVKCAAQGNKEIKGSSWYQSPVSILHAIILERNKQYSIYDKSSFQCRRLGKPFYVWYTNKWPGCERSAFDVARDRAATRQGMSTGNPGIFRTSTGELALATMLVYGGVMQLFGNHENGFDSAPVNFLNDICKEFFGDGLNKTCAKDWLKLNDNINTNDEIPSTDIQTLYETSLDKTLMPQMNKDTNEKLSMTLSTNDVAVEITEEKQPDYAVKW